MNHFYEGLITAVKDLLVLTDESDILDKLIALAIKMNARDNERKLKKKLKATSSKKSLSLIILQALSSKSSAPLASSFRALFPAVIADDTISMNNIINRITSKERKHRRINNLCYYCDFADHKRVNCFKRLMRQVQINIGVMFIFLEFSIK